MRAGTDDDRQLQLFTIPHIKKQSVHYRILRSYKDTRHGPSGESRTHGLLNPIQASWQIVQLLRLHELSDFCCNSVAMSFYFFYCREDGQAWNPAAPLTMTLPNANLEQPLFPNKYNKLLFICIGKENGGKRQGNRLPSFNCELFVNLTPSRCAFIRNLHLL